MPRAFGRDRYLKGARAGALTVFRRRWRHRATFVRQYPTDRLRERDRQFESRFLQRRVACEPEFQGRMSRCTQGSETDPVDFRLRHLDDPRARDAITAAAERFRLVAFSAEGRGVGAASPLRGIRISAPVRRLPLRSALSMGAAASAWCVALPLWIAARRSITTASATRSKGAFSNPRAGRFTKASPSTSLFSGPIGQHRASKRR